MEVYERRKRALCRQGKDQIAKNPLSESPNWKFGYKRNHRVRMDGWMGPPSLLLPCSPVALSRPLLLHPMTIGFGVNCMNNNGRPLVKWTNKCYSMKTIIQKGSGEEVRMWRAFSHHVKWRQWSTKSHA